MDYLTPEEKKSEHLRRLEWLEAMEKAPECCRKAEKMKKIGVDLYQCEECRRVWEKVDKLMYCVQ